MKRTGLLGAAVLGGAGLLLPLTAAGTYAHSTVCRSDPILALSNGKTLQLTASINDAQSDVTKVLYAAAIPAGVSVNRITFTSGWSTAVEQVTVTANQAANTYVSTTTVTTKTASYSFTAADNLLLGSTTLATGSASGTSKTSSGSVAGKATTIKLVG